MLGSETRNSMLYSFPVVGLLAATPLVALRIPFSPPIEVAGSLLLAAAMPVLTWLLFQQSSPLLKIAASSLVASMALACTYVVSEFASLHWITIPPIVWSHGRLNAVSFATCALLDLEPARHLTSLSSH